MSEITLFLIRLGILLVASHGAGFFFARVLKLPRVLGEMGVGILLGYELLGKLPIFGSGSVLFSPDVIEYAPFHFVITFATVILLFNAGMHTDLRFFLKFFLKGSLIGTVGVLASYIVAATLTVFFIDGIHSIFHPTAIFMGIATSTSVGISARILTEKNKLNSLEGNVSMTAAVLDDVLGIVFLAVAVRITALYQNSPTDVVAISAISVILLVGKELGLWLLLTIIGIIISRILAKYLRMLTPYTAIGMSAMGFVLLMGGVAESVGLSVVIGAYILGLGFSTIDTSIEIQARINDLAGFFVPVFFTLTGIMIDFAGMKSGLVFSLLYALVTLFTKFFACGLVSGTLGFNIRGMTRIGFIMLPRGEVTLVIANMGVVLGVLTSELFATLAFTVLFSVLITPLLLQLAFKTNKSGYRKPIKSNEGTISFNLEPLNTMTKTYLLDKILNIFRESNYFVYVLDVPSQTYQFRKKNIGIVMRGTPNGIYFSTQQDNVDMVKFLIIEELAEMQSVLSNLHSSTLKDNKVEKQLLSGILEEKPIK